MKIIYLVPSLIKSGPINVVYNIVRNLNRKQYTPIVAFLSEHPFKERNNQDSFEELGIRVVPHKFSKWQLQFQTRTIARQLQEELDGPNVIFHAHGYYPTLLLSYMKNILSMTTLHNRCREDFCMHKGVLLGNYMTYKFFRAINNIDINVAISHTTEQYYIHKASKTCTVCNGVTVNKRCTYEERVIARKSLNLSDHTNVLLYPAGFSKIKNQKRIIEELRSKRDADFLVLFAGQGILENECKKLAGHDPRFQFLGYQMDLNRYWAAADFLISSSISEGFGMIVAEGLTRGIPCILSDIAAHQELVDSIPGSGICFPLNKEGALRLAFEKALTTNFDHNAIRNKAIELYSAQTMCRRYEALYQQLYDKSQHIKA